MDTITRRNTNENSMEENIDELQAKIAAVQGKIDTHKQQQHVSPYATKTHHPSPSPYRGAPRWTPYGRGRGGGRGGHYAPVKNLSLVLNGSSTPTDLPTPTTRAQQQPDKFVATHTHQLVNKETLQRRQQDKDKLRAAKRQKINQHERTTLNQHTAGQGGRELLIEGIRFQLRADGSKLERVSGMSSNSTDESEELKTIDSANLNLTPKMVKVADVAFFRTKNGNLVRANAVKDLTRYCTTIKPCRQAQDSLDLISRTSTRAKRQCEHFTKHGILKPYQILQASFHLKEFPQSWFGHPDLFHTDALTGKCPFGRSCRFAHDPEKVAICPASLKNKCTAGEYCDLSHVMSINRVPACIHFLRGNCTNDACRYPHVNVSPSAPVCAPFARLGYCANNDCDKRHVFECPDFANKGECPDSTCPLPHPVRAHVLRKAAAKQAKVGSEDESDISSDEEEQETQTGFEDIDSDEAEIMMGDDHDNGHELTQQQDFVSLS